MSNPAVADVHTQQAVLAVASGLAKDQWERKFMASVSDQFSRKGELSGPQWVIVDRIAHNEYQLDEYPAKAPASPDTVTTDAAAVFQFFAAAQAHLKYPKVRLLTADGDTLVCRIAGARSKYRGCVTVTDDGRYPNNKWYGHIAEDGTWHLPRSGAPEEVQSLVQRLAADPAGVAAEYGRLTGSCCFCGRHLEDAKSTAVGYGPTCAKNFGVPWGVRAARAATSTVTDHRDEVDPMGYMGKSEAGLLEQAAVLQGELLGKPEPTQDAPDQVEPVELTEPGLAAEYRSAQAQYALPF